jgi:type IV pilus assembly protein PilO
MSVWAWLGAVSLDRENIGELPLMGKAAVGLLLALLVLAVGYGVFLAAPLVQLDQRRAEEVALKQQFAAKALQGANLERYQEQLQVMATDFAVLVGQLPSDSEIPGVLEDITRVGLGNGLVFEAFKVQPEVPRPFYLELPIRITLSGAYHDLAAFVSGVASLPRIITLHDFEIEPLEPGDGSRLRMSIQARTYRYSDRGESS